jgi:hypothetical protein
MNRLQKNLKDKLLNKMGAIYWPAILLEALNKFLKTFYCFQWLKQHVSEKLAELLRSDNLYYILFKTFLE